MEMQEIDDDNWDEDEYMRQRMEWLHAADKKARFIEYSDARENGDVALCEALEEKNPYLFNIYEELGPCLYSEYERYQDLVMHWFICLHKNSKYKKYCEAKDANDIKIITDLEKKEPFLASLYADWGDIYAWDGHAREWGKNNHHLFFPELIEIVQPGQPVPSSVLATTLPEGFVKHEFVDGLFFLSRELAENVGRRPKYQIEKFRGETFAMMAQRMSLAHFVYDLVMEQDISFRDMTEMYFYDSEIFKGMGTRLSDKQSDSPKSADDIKSKRTTIENMVNLYQQCIDNAIKGVFPVKYERPKSTKGRSQVQ
ncbi:hypothetical protein [Ralstonia sp. RL]|uniref:hypothetical protein n=1 Tax=Ralstonia sp. RL TaxID=1839756 RepID=UPI00257B488C|nr:hypothetical protein [Ralstonia sp. RL]